MSREKVFISFVAKALEEKRAKGEIGSSFDAKIKLLSNSKDRYKVLKSLKGELAEIFKVSQAEVEAAPHDAIEVHKAEGTKCVRCWNYSLSVGAHKEHALICERCLTAIGGR